MGVFGVVLWFALLAVKGFALVDAVIRKPGDFEAANTLQKKAWLLLLGLGLATHLFSPTLGLLGLAGTVAALVYLAQLRGSQRSY